jgi:hypothetical protein
MKLIVNGRHLEKFARFDPKNIITDFRIHDDSVTLRLDDKENLSWWIEVDIPKEVLKSVLKEMESREADEDKEEDEK